MSILVVASGQSNCMGGQGSEGGDLTLNNHVFAWKGSSWGVATPGQNPFPTESPTRNNPMWQFCKKLQEQTGDNIYLVLSGLEGTSINAWASPSGVRWVDLNSQVGNALASSQLSGKTGADVFLWFQGEADDTGTDYKSKFLALRQAAINSGWLTTATPVIAGEIIENNGAKKELASLLLDDNSWFALAYNDNCARASGGPHFTGQGYVDLGRIQFWNAYKRLPRTSGKAIMIPWYPRLKSAAGTPTVTHNELQTFGGLRKEGDLCHAWFKMTCSSIQGGSGQAKIAGFPVVPDVNLFNSGGWYFGGVASVVSNASYSTGSPTILRATPDGFDLFRANANGVMMPISIGELANGYTIVGSVSFICSDD